ncbi:MAG: hypothetical protein AAGF59_01620 [Pseudomonadota bacterium]
MKITLPLVILVSAGLGACAASSWSPEQYGPRWGGYVGGYYGYQEKDLGSGSYRVSYTDVSRDDASRKMRRRASELCQARDEGISSIGPESSSAGGFAGPAFTVSADVLCGDPPPAPSPGAAVAGNIGKARLRSCSNSAIEQQIAEIIREGERLKRGAGLRRTNEITAQVLSESISIYRQAINRCDVDRAAFEAAISSLERSRAVALSNVGRTSN